VANQFASNLSILIWTDLYVDCYPSRAAPAFVVPMAAQPVAKLPEGGDWLYELKLDGSPYFSGVSSITAHDSLFGECRPRLPVLPRYLAVQ
jgi:hypothetical protein